MMISVRKLTALVLVLATVGQLTGAFSLREQLSTTTMEPNSTTMEPNGTTTEPTTTTTEPTTTTTEPTTTTTEPTTTTTEPTTTTTEPTTTTTEPTTTTTEPTTTTTEPTTTTTEPTTTTTEPTTTTTEPTTTTTEPTTTTTEPTTTTTEPTTTTTEPTTTTTEPTTTTTEPTTTTTEPTTTTTEPTTTTTEPTTTTTEKPTPAPLTECPPLLELIPNLCLCNSHELTLHCSHFLGPFGFSKTYHLQRLVIHNSDLTDLSQAVELFSPQKITFRSLTIENNLLLQHIEPELLQLFSESVHIGINPLAELDFSQLRPELTSIHVDRVKSLSNFPCESNQYPNLQKLHLTHLSFPSVSDQQTLNINASQYPALRDLKIDETNLEGEVRFVPSADKCGQYLISLQNNFIRFFDFDSLFSTSGSDCMHYQVSLTHSQRIDPRLLTSQLKSLSQHVSQLDVNLNGLNLQCNCDLYKLYHSEAADHTPFSNHFHHIYCYSHNSFLHSLSYDDIC